MLVIAGSCQCEHPLRQAVNYAGFGAKPTASACKEPQQSAHGVRALPSTAMAHLSIAIPRFRVDALFTLFTA
jgi:hypothetical protein